MLKLFAIPFSSDIYISHLPVESPSPPPSHPSRSSECRPGSPCYTAASQQCSWCICSWCICSCVYARGVYAHVCMLVPLPPSVPPSPPPPRPQVPLHLHFHPSLQIGSQYHFSRFCIHALIYNICFIFLTYFTLYFRFFPPH